jgi:hypothetical protein
MKIYAKTTETETINEPTENRDRPQEKCERNPENIPYYESEKIHRRINRKDQYNQQFDEDGEVIDSRNGGFQQSLDEDS